MRYAFSAAALMFGTSAAFAQLPPANPNGHTPAVATSGTVNPDAPVAGKNSFTESQARTRLEAAGFTGVSGLAMDKKGIWHGTASKAGTMQTVNLDFQGNITSN